ncbi:MAG: DNA glycosylase [Muricomes sp.]
MIEKTIEYFDISQICDSGQCFRMGKKDENTYFVIAGDKYVEVSQIGNQCTFRCAEEEFENFWKYYFDFDTDYEEYRKCISPRDSYLMNAAQFGRGIRILNQDLWEMIVSFLISQQNNIVRIRRCIQNICETYGEEKQSQDGNIYYSFPSPEVLAELDEDALKECNLGYRSKYVVRTARSIVSGEVSLDTIRKMSYKKAKEELLKLFGVGEKVADCICLFALHQMQAFPVDTHINTALKQHYPKGFPKRRYKNCEGIMQQYIFYYELLGKKKDIWKD